MPRASRKLVDTPSLRAALSRPPRYLGIDPGLRLTGWGVVEFSGWNPQLIAGGVIRLNPKQKMSDRLLELDREMASLLAEYAPDACGVEAIYSHYAHPRTGILMAHARGVILLAIRRASVALEEYLPTRIKRSLVGNGHASKAQMQTSIQLLWKLDKPPSPPDVADALAIAICCGRSRMERVAVNR